MSATDSSPDFFIDVELQKNCLVSLQIEISSDCLRREKENAIKKSGRSLSVPGFRKGKAPRQYLLSHFSEQIDKEWRKTLALLALETGIEKSGFSPLENDKTISRCSWRSFDLEKGALLQIEYETTPDLSFFDPALLQAQMPEKQTLRPDSVQKELYRLANRFGSWKEEEELVFPLDPERELWVTLDVKNDQEELLYPSQTKFSVHKLPEDLLQLIQGLKRQESTQGFLKDPRREPQKEEEPLVEVSLLLTSIVERLPAPIDDNLAQKCGFETLDKLQERIEKMMALETEKEYRQLCFDSIGKALEENYLFDLPLSLLETQQEIAFQKLLTKKEGAELSEQEKQSAKERAEKSTRADFRRLFLLHAVAKKENLRAEKEEIEERLGPILNSLLSEKDLEKRREQFRSLYNRCASQIISEKASEHIAKDLGWL